VIADDPGNRSLQDLILASMALGDEADEPLTIEHEATDDDEEPI